jgi:ribonuclease HIII
LIVHSFTVGLTPPQVTALQSLLQEQGFEFQSRPYTIFFAQKGKLTIAVYEKGPKAVLQGKDAEEFIRFELEPKILQEARLDYDELLRPEMFEPHFGIDESGKGDFFGPLVIAGVYTERATAKELVALGVVDSKRIGSDRRIKALAEGITRLPGVISNVVMIGPKRYNELYARFGNLNDLLAWGHARVIENLLQLKPDCPRALSDQFANPRVVRQALLERGRLIQVDQRTKAESDIAVAAASILARRRFVEWLEQTSKDVQVLLPKGASSVVKAAARQIVEARGREFLSTIAKMHFKTAQELESGVL